MRKYLCAALAIALGVAVGCASPRASSPAAAETKTASAPTAPTKSAGSSAAAVPATAPAGARKELSPFAKERFRMVQGTDEIVSVLDNGAVVICKRVVGSPVLSVRGYVKAGSLYEGKWEGGGLSHLLEHLVAGGSNERYTEAQSREILQQLGNNSNAFTTLDQTAYFINTTPQYLDKAVDVLTGWMLYARITEDEYKREYQVVQRELEMGKGEAGRQFYEISEMNRYRVSPARVPTIGYQEVIQGLKRDDVYAYYKMAYQPNNMIFAVAGDLEPEAMLKSFQRYIDAPAGRVFSHNIADEPAVMAPRTLVATFPKLGEAEVSLAYPSVRLDHPDLYALDLLAAVIGQSESSPLVREVRDKRLVSSISSYDYTPSFVDGSFVVAFHCQPDKMEPAMEAVQLILERAKREPFDEALIKRARTQMKVDHLRQLQETQNVAGSMAEDYMSAADVHFTEKYLERLAAVTPADLQAMARKYIDNQRLVKTIMLPEEATQAQGLPAAAELVRSAGHHAATATAPTSETFEVKREVLDNGTILLTRRVPSSQLIAVRMYAAGGLTAENPKVSGIGNLTMRMLTRGTSFRSAAQIAEQLDALGASVETACGNNSWYWNASMLKEDFEKGMEVYADVVNNPSFAVEELEGIRRRVLAGIAAQDADWSGQAIRYFKRQYFPDTSPYHLQVTGEADVVKSLTADDLKKWYQEGVLRGHRVLAIYGDIDPQTAKDVAAKLLGGGAKVPSEAPVLPAAVVGEPRPGGPQMNVERVEIQQTRQPLAGVVIGFDARSLIADPTTPIMDVAKTVTSGWGYPTGYLHETLRGEGLVYVVQAQNWPGRTEKMPGTFFVFAGCEPANVTKVVDEILLNIARLQGTPQDIQVDWFGRAKQLLITDEAMSNETVSEQASTAALDELWGLGYDYQKGFTARVQKVTIEDVQKLARARLNSCVVTICTPQPDLVKVPTGSRKYSSFPEVELTPKGVAHDVGAAK